jgi:hypothetical protein
VNSTVRVGTDLGFATAVFRAAVIGFDMPDAALSARVLFDVTMTCLEADFVTMVETTSIVAAADRGRRWRRCEISRHGSMAQRATVQSAAGA